MYTLDTVPFNNRFSRLSSELYSPVKPQGLMQPFLVSANPAVADLIGLDPEALTTDSFIEYFSGNAILPNAHPLAMVYSGHQFGSYNPQLGDGRGLLLGEVETASKGTWDLHLKGAGQTPYSRFADGRAVLRSTIREYLCSEAMAGLGIATTRGLCIIGSETPVYRETSEMGATLVRVAQSHIRFGSFEYFHYNNRPDIVKQLADYVITRNYPELQHSETKYADFLLAVVARTASMIAQWQAVGFAHGVMNTDNMSIAGDTFDFGPFGFLDDYNPNFICNHSDHEGRYAFNQQPGIGLWNLNALAHALSTLIDRESITNALSQYERLLVDQYNQIFRSKLGLLQEKDGDVELVGALLHMLEQQKADYTNFFRLLSHCNHDSSEIDIMLRDRFVDRQSFDTWMLQYQQRLIAENSDPELRRQTMLNANPKYILRNYIAQQAIDKATKDQDYSDIGNLLTILQSPFEEHPLFSEYASAPPDWGKRLEISCSS
ncbi:MAG: YdiU family protein [Oceanicoccus sp.]